MPDSNSWSFSRSSPSRPQQGWHALVKPGETLSLCDVTPQRPSRLTVTVGASNPLVRLPGASGALVYDASIELTSRVDEGKLVRVLALLHQGVCVALPLGRTVASVSLSGSYSLPLDVWAVVGVGFPNTETVSSGGALLPPGAKHTYPAPAYARAARVALLSGDLYVTIPKMTSQALSWASGPRELVVYGTESVELLGAGLGGGAATVGWEVVA